MDFRVSFGWHILYRADDALMGKPLAPSLVRLSEPTQYFNRISATNPTLYHPIDIEPTNLFHLHLRRALSHVLGAIREKNFPYNFAIESLGYQCRIGLNIQLFLPDLLSLRLTCYSEVPLDPNSAFKFRRLHNHPKLLSLCSAVLKIVSSQLHPNGSFTYLQNHPVIKITSDSRDDSVLAKHQKFFVALLINDEKFEESDPSIFQRVLSANEDHNKKARNSKLILMNKQAYLAVTNGNSNNEPIVLQEIRKRELMFELGYALQSFYDTYSTLRQLYPREMDYLFFATQPYIKEFDLTFRKSYGNSLAWQVLLDTLHLRAAFNSAARFDVQRESRLSNLFDRISRPNYANADFWEDVRQKLGEDYMSMPAGNNNFNIGTNNGSISVGDGSTANTLNFGQNTEALLKVIEQLAQLRQEVAEGMKREEFDELIVGLRAEIKSGKADGARVSKMLRGLKSLAEGVASHVVAIGLVHEAGKLLGSVI